MARMARTRSLRKKRSTARQICAVATYQEADCECQQVLHAYTGVFLFQKLRRANVLSHPRWPSLSTLSRMRSANPESTSPCGNDEVPVAEPIAPAERARAEGDRLCMAANGKGRENERQGKR
eukprot:394427-Pleurochrysis_carterae.AAC.2